jgi:hypothetical protein
MDSSTKRFIANCNPNDFDRNIQNKMFTQIPLNKWCIIHTRNTERDAN